MPIVTTLTVETQFVVVNKRTNQTRTSTVFNTDSIESYQRPQTNSAGTAYTTVISMDGDKTSHRTM